MFLDWFAESVKSRGFVVYLSVSLQHQLPVQLEVASCDQ